MVHYRRDHYEDLARLRPSLIVSFWAEIDKSGLSPESLDASLSGLVDSPCWLWLGRMKKGYGMWSWYNKASRKTVTCTASALAYFLIKGKLPEDGLELDHICKVRFCCNPDHMEPVSHPENLRRRLYLEQG